MKTRVRRVGIKYVMLIHTLPQTSKELGWTRNSKIAKNP